MTFMAVRIPVLPHPRSQRSHESPLRVDTRRNALALFALGLVACSSGSNDSSGLSEPPGAAGDSGGVGTGITNGMGGAISGAAGGAGRTSGTSGVGVGGPSAGGPSASGRSGGAGTSGPSAGGPSAGRASTAGTDAGGPSAGRVSTAGTNAGGAGTGGVGGASTSGGRGGTSGAPAAGTGGTLSCSGARLSGGSAHCSSNDSGNTGAYSWSIWSSGSGGCITPYGVGAAFKATWNNSGDFLAREGLQWNETKTFDQYGTISAEYAYTKTGSAGGYSYIGIYGWSNNPLIEFYIVDDWYGSGPPTGGGDLKGSFDVDGSTYKIYTHTQTNQPSIHGTQTFVQFFSVRQTARQCGHISVTEHFKKWASLGMKLGNMYEAKILVEAGGGNGSIDFTTATMTAQ